VWQKAARKRTNVHLSHSTSFFTLFIHIFYMFNLSSDLKIIIVIVIKTVYTISIVLFLLSWERRKFLHVQTPDTFC